MCEVNDLKISCYKYKDLMGTAVIVLEKKGAAAVADDDHIMIMELDPFRKVRDISFENASGFCMDPDEKMLMCYDKGDMLMTINPMTWEYECKSLDLESLHQYNDECEDDDRYDEDDEYERDFEIDKMIYISKKLVLIVSSVNKGIFIYDLENGESEKIHSIPCVNRDIKDVRYNADENRLTILSRGYFYETEENQWFRYRKLPAVRSEMLGTDIQVESMKFSDHAVYCDPVNGYGITYRTQGKLFRKKSAIFTYYDFLKDVEIQENAGNIVYHRIFGSSYDLLARPMGYEGLIAIPFVEGISICRIKDGRFKHMGSYFMGVSLWDFAVYNNGRNLIAAGTDMIMVLSVQ